MSHSYIRWNEWAQDGWEANSSWPTIMSDRRERCNSTASRTLELDSKGGCFYGGACKECQEAPISSVNAPLSIWNMILFHTTCAFFSDVFKQTWLSLVNVVFAHWHGGSAGTYSLTCFRQGTEFLMQVPVKMSTLSTMTKGFSSRVTIERWFSSASSSP